MKIIDKIIIDINAPLNKSVLWIDISDGNRIPKIYMSGEWLPLQSGVLQENNL